MRLGPKLAWLFLGFILLSGGVSAASVGYMLDRRMMREMETGELAFARSLSLRLFKSVKDRDSIALTDALMDELLLRPGKLEYLLVLDGQETRLAHTYLMPLPERLRQLPITREVSLDASHVERLRARQLDVYDVTVPVFEGVSRIGSIHVGLKSSYLNALKVDLFKVIALVTTGIGALAMLLAFWLTRRIVRPLRQLTAVANQLSQGELDVVLPGLRTGDELEELESSIERVLDAVSTLMEELDAAVDALESQGTDEDS